jgi:hypothetical protein
MVTFGPKLATHKKGTYPYIDTKTLSNGWVRLIPIDSQKAWHTSINHYTLSTIKTARYLGADKWRAQELELHVKGKLSETLIWWFP